MLTLDGGPLGIDDVVAVARRGEPVAVSPAVTDRMRPSREAVARIDAGNEVAYGVTTGFGALADRAVGREQREALQRALVLSHAAGMGPALDAEVVRGMLLLRARTLAAGHSGVRRELVEALAVLLNSGPLPWVPERGSLGASGDLAPLAHAAATLLGEGWFVGDGGEPVASAPVLEGRGLPPLRLVPKEGLALINGTDASTAALALAVRDVESLLRAADCACAMSVEALLGTSRPFAPDVAALRPAPGQQASAENIAALLTGSPMVASHRESHHAVQDAYSLRCAPQVHGAARDVVAFCRTTVEREMASIVDNPVVLDGEVVSAGNFHAQALAYAADMLAAVCADVAAISERRVDRLLDPSRSRGLPAFLSPDPGLNSGFMIAQYTAAATVAALRHAAAPLAVHSAVTSAGQEDHVSMSFEAARRTRASVPMLRSVLAVELCCAAQALELRAPLRPAPATAALLEAVRAIVAPLREDRVLAGDLAALEGWVNREGFEAAAAGAAGPLR
ncbi:MAG: histidine ammonia-lyase [Candidatus Dormibacteraeota bacterium]|nr:histidine ammonia-lyase [Candidatus Dormibacteraeota bacterium]